MSGHPGDERKLCLLGRVAQKLGCLPNKFTTRAQVYYPISVRPADSVSGYGYGDDIKLMPGPLFPPPQPDMRQPQMSPYVAPRQYQSLQVPKAPNKTPVAQTVPLSTLPLPVNALPGGTPATTCVAIGVDLPPVRSTVQVHTPYLASLSAVPRTPYQNMVPDSIFQDLGHITPTQYTWNTPHGALTYTPAPASALPLPNPLANFGPSSPRIFDIGDGNEPTGLGLIPSPFSSDASDLPDSSSDCSGSGSRSGVTLHPLLASNPLLAKETPIEWSVSDPADRARHILDESSFVRSADEPATQPPTTTLCIKLHFIDDPGVEWNWELITVRKGRPIRIADVFHAVYEYFHTQLTHSEYDTIKSYGRPNARIVKNSWRERFNSQPMGEARDAVYNGGLRRVDCLGSSNNFAGLWINGSQLMLGLRA